MNRIWKAQKINRLVRVAKTASEIMTANPVSIEHTAKVPYAATMLSDREISAAPVINEAGRPVGVVSRTDIVRHLGGDLGAARSTLLCDSCANSAFLPRETSREELDPTACSCTSVWDIMTPEIFTTETNASIVQIVEELLGRDVHRLFVVDENGILVGVVTALDVLRGLRR